MRILHTSDWHLGRLFHNVHLTSDQAHILDDFVRYAADAKPDLVVIAGDLYDRSVPPPEAVELLDEVLSKLVLEVGVPVVAIAGNHDSAERVGFASRLLDAGRMHLIGGVGQTRALTFDDAFGPVDVVPMPFASPEALRSFCGDDALRGFSDSMARQIALATSGLVAGRRRVAVAHAFVTGGSESESERQLTVGGAGDVPAGLFAGFAYTALGHLHRPQRVAGGDSGGGDSGGGDSSGAGQNSNVGQVRYSGSLLPYSFSEVDHQKSVTLVEIDAAGATRVELTQLRAKRGMRIVEGTLAALLDAGRSDPARDDYVLARVLDRRPVLDAMAQLRSIYPNTLHIERPELMTTGSLPSSGDHRKMAPIDLFADFWEAVGDGSALDTDQHDIVIDAISVVQQRAQ